MMKHICRNCGFEVSKRARPGNDLFEIVLWLLIGFGVFYTMLRSAAPKICPICGAASQLVPLETPEGKRLREHFGSITAQYGKKPAA